MTVKHFYAFVFFTSHFGLLPARKNEKKKRNKEEGREGGKKEVKRKRKRGESNLQCTYKKDSFYLGIAELLALEEREG